jgi:glutamate-5-semialdehyde dehydrogenase
MRGHAVTGTACAVLEERVAMDVLASVRELASRARAAAARLAAASSAVKDSALRAMADGIEANAERLKEENACDVAAAEQAGLSAALVDRLRLTDKRVAAMAEF